MTVLGGRPQPAASRDSLAESLVGDREPMSKLLPEVRDARESTATLEGRWAVSRVQRFHRDGVRLDDKDAARLLVAIESITTRDRLWLDMNRGNAASHVALWTDLTRRAPDEVRAAPASLLAFGSWLSGHGALAWCAIDQVPEGKLLPESADEYVEAAATTVEDVETLAPVVPEQVRRTVEEADPTRDEDVADWFDETEPRPKLQLLGPARVHAFGGRGCRRQVPSVLRRARRLPRAPSRGCLQSESGRGLRHQAVTRSHRLSTIRDWLGTNARTGELILPRRDLNAPAHTVDNGYTLHGLLVDVDRFRRLRTRGQARGADGINDLRIALKLIVGKPFSNLPKDGWAWLFEGEHLHEIAEQIIVDTVHIVAVAAQAEDDLDTARWASEIACEAAPYDEICRLDLVKVAAAQGHIELAERMLNHDVFNRTDDFLPPIDLPKRTRGVVEKEGWGNAPSPNRVGVRTNVLCVRITVVEGDITTQEAGWTTAGALPATWVIHVVAPNFNAGETDRSLLLSYYTRALAVADELGARDVAFSLISAGIYGWPKDDAIDAALEVLRSATTNVEEARIVAFGTRPHGEILARFRDGR